MSNQENELFSSSEGTQRNSLGDRSNSVVDVFPAVCDDHPSKEEFIIPCPDVGKNLSSSFLSTTGQTEEFRPRHSSGDSSITEGATGGSSLLSVSEEHGDCESSPDKCAMDSGKLFVFQRYFEEPKLRGWDKPESRRRHCSMRHDTPQIGDLFDLPSIIGDMNNNEAGPFVPIGVEDLADALRSISIVDSKRSPIANQAGAIVGHSKEDSCIGLMHSIGRASTVPIKEAYLGSDLFFPKRQEPDDYKVIQGLPDSSRPKEVRSKTSKNERTSTSNPEFCNQVQYLEKLSKSRTKLFGRTSTITHDSKPSGQSSEGRISPPSDVEKGAQRDDCSRQLVPIPIPLECTRESKISDDDS